MPDPVGTAPGSLSESPDFGRPADGAFLFRYRNNPLIAWIVKVLEHRHGADTKPGGKHAGILRAFSFQKRNGPETSEFRVEDPSSFIAGARESLFDHSRFEHIVSCHLTKLTTATEREIAANPDGPQVPLMTAALNRFLQGSITRRNVLGTANQALNLVELEG